MGLLQVIKEMDSWINRLASFCEELDVQEVYSGDRVCLLTTPQHRLEGSHLPTYHESGRCLFLQMRRGDAISCPLEPTSARNSSSLAKHWLVRGLFRLETE